MTANGQRINEIDQQIENLTDQISRTNDRGARDRYERKMSQLDVDKEQLIVENEQVEQEIKGLRECENDLKQKRDTALEVYSYLGSGRGENERIELRLKLRNQIQNTFEWIRIYPLQEAHKEAEEVEEPGIVKFMKSKFMDKIRMRFKGTHTLSIVYFKSFGEEQ